MPKSTKLFVQYTDEYKAKCFIVWYTAGRPTGMNHIMDIVPQDALGRKPNVNLLKKWRDEDGWLERADELDARAMEKVDNTLVKQKAEMLQRQAGIGRELQEKGIDHLRKMPLDSSAAAIAAIVKGAELERSSLGMSDFMLRMSKMSDADLRDAIVKLASRSDGTIIDADEVEIQEDKSETPE